MNTAVRAVVGGMTFPWHCLGKVRLSFSRTMMVALSVGVILTALGIVYVKDMNRRLFIHYQSLEAASQAYDVTWGKLLLEQSTWDRQSRIERIAQQDLNMVFPDPARVHIINIPHHISPVFLSKNERCSTRAGVRSCLQNKAIIDT